MGKIIDGIYYGSDGNPAHRGIVKIDDAFYYAGEDGILVKDRQKNVHKEMTNELVEHGTYRFDAEGRLIPESYRKPEKRTKKKLLKFLGTSKRKKKENRIVAIAMGSLCLLALAIGLLNHNPFGGHNRSSSNSSAQTAAEVVLPTFDKEVYLCSSGLEAFYQGNCSLEKAIDSSAEAYMPLVFSYELPEGYTATLIISEDSKMTNAVEYPLETGKQQLNIDNLYTGRTYHYQVNIVTANGEEDVRLGAFTTADTNRFITLPGVYNTRDIGGYDTSYGKKIKQGMLIRGTEIDGLVESKYFLTDKDAAAPFGFVCDLDLRSGTIFDATYQSRLGSQVSHKFYDSPQYSGIFSNGYKESLRQIFADLADKKNYPMYLHCTYGQDRTGTIVFLLQGILGVSEEDMKTEYELTGFFNHDYVYGTSLNGIYGGLEGMAGNTINEKIENYLVGTVGVTPQQIQSIREIFLEAN